MTTQSPSAEFTAAVPPVGTNAGVAAGSVAQVAQNVRQVQSRLDASRPMTSQWPAWQEPLDDLQRIAAMPGDAAEVLDEFLATASVLGRTSYLAYIRAEGDRSWKLFARNVSTKKPWTAAEQQRFDQWWPTACLAGRVRCERIENGASLTALHLPVPTDTEKPDSLVVAWHGALADVEAAVVRMQIVVAQILRWWERQSLNKARWEANVMAALSELQAGIAACSDFETATRYLVNELQRYCDCHLVAIGTVAKRSSQIKLRAISGVETLDSASQQSVLFQQAMQSMMQHRRPLAWSAGAESLGHLASEGNNAAQTTTSVGELQNEKVRQAAIEANVAAAWCSPIWDRKNEIVASVLFLGTEEQLNGERSAAALRCICGGIGDTLVARTEVATWRNKGRSAFLPSRRNLGRLAWLGAMSLGALALVTVKAPYRISTTCQVEPTTKRTVVAPSAGILESVLVRPGDEIQAGDVLAKMDSRETELELASLAAERTAAEQKRDAALVAEDITAAHLAQLEMNRLDGKIGVLREQQQRHVIVSPLDGIVMLGEFANQSSVPVSLGQSLFEVAPQDDFKIEVAIPEHELSHAQVGHDVTVRLEGIRQRNLSGVIQRIEPVAKLRDGQNVFVAELKLHESSEGIRPGLSGQATILGDENSLAYNLFHWAWERVIASVR